MISKLLNKSSLFRLLLRIEIDLAEQVQKSDCPYCNGPLHQAYYERKPCGGPEDIPKECSTRRVYAVAMKIVDAEPYPFLFYLWTGELYLFRGAK